MTQKSVDEYLKAIRDRYLKGSKEEKGKILDEFTKVTGIHRKAAIKLLNRVAERSTPKRRGRKRKYDPAVAASLKTIWEASDRLCSRRLQPFLPEMIKVLRQHGEQKIDASTEAQLRKMSPSTIDRMRQSLPFPLLGVDSDNGSEFVNGASTPIVMRRRLHSPALVSTKRMIAAMWSRRTAMWCGLENQRKRRGGRIIY
jgi:hypothetical protein